MLELIVATDCENKQSPENRLHWFFDDNPAQMQGTSISFLDEQADLRMTPRSITLGSSSREQSQNILWAAGWKGLQALILDDSIPTSGRSAIGSIDWSAALEGLSHGEIISDVNPNEPLRVSMVSAGSSLYCAFLIEKGGLSGYEGIGFVARDYESHTFRQMASPMIPTGPLLLRGNSLLFPHDKKIISLDTSTDTIHIEAEEMPYRITGMAASSNALALTDSYTNLHLITGGRHYQKELKVKATSLCFTQQLREGIGLPVGEFLLVGTRDGNIVALDNKLSKVNQLRVQTSDNPLVSYVKNLTIGPNNFAYFSIYKDVYRIAQASLLKSTGEKYQETNLVPFKSFDHRVITMALNNR